MVEHMTFRALLFITALLASSARAQEPGFALSGDSVRKIVHDTAAMQSQVVRIEAPAKAVVREVHFEPVDVAAPAPPLPVSKPRPLAKPKKQGPLSALIDVLVDSALGVSDDLPSIRDERLHCLARGGDGMNSTELDQACPSLGKHYPVQTASEFPPQP
jgi:hypothetical protein